MIDMRLERVPFEFDGHTFQLCCNMNVLADVQEAFDGKISEALSGKAGVRSLMEFLAAMLNDSADEQGIEARYTSRQVGRMLAPVRMNEVKAIVMRLVGKAMSADTELSTEEKPKKLTDQVEPESRSIDFAWYLYAWMSVLKLDERSFWRTATPARVAALLQAAAPRRTLQREDKQQKSLSAYLLGGGG